MVLSERVQGSGCAQPSADVGSGTINLQRHQRRTLGLHLETTETPGHVLTALLSLQVITPIICILWDNFAGHVWDQLRPLRPFVRQAFLLSWFILLLFHVCWPYGF